MTTTDTGATSPPHGEPPGATSLPPRGATRADRTDAPWRPAWAIAATSAFAIAGTLVVAIMVGGGADDSANTPTPEPLQLSAGESNALASCLPFEVSTLSGMSPAFAATVTANEDETVTLSVDKWYAGDPGTDVVELSAPAGMEALIGGFDLTVGDQYLLTSTNGTVNYCGYSGPATTEMTNAFEQAFPD